MPLSFQIPNASGVPVHLRRGGLSAVGALATAAQSGAAQIEALQTISGDLALVAKLSPEAQAVISIAQTALEYISSTPIGQLVESEIQSLAAAFSNAVGSVSDAAVSAVDAGESIPVIQFIAAAVKIVMAVYGAYAASVQETGDVTAQGCSMFMQSMAIPMIDSTYVTPADIFALVYGPDGTTPPGGVFVTYWGMAYQGPPNTPGLFPSALGWALMIITEGAGYSPAQYGWLCNYANQQNFSAATGIPPARRAQFTKVRQAIVSQLGVVGSSEGADLWPLYLDMLRIEYVAGHIDEGLANFLLQSAGRIDDQFNLTDPLDPDAPACDFSPLAHAIMGPVNSLRHEWESEINPVTASDVKARAQFLADVKSATQKILGVQASADPTSKLLASLKTLSPAQIERSTVNGGVRAVMGLSALRKQLQNPLAHLVLPPGLFK